MRRSLLLFSAVCIAISRTLHAGVTVAPGEDWSLPAWVQPVPYSGFFTVNVSNETNPLIRNIGFTLTWYDLNPAEGVYDFHWVDQKLAEAKARNAMVMFRMKSSVLNGPEQGTVDNQPQLIPQWVIAKHHPATFRTNPTKTYAALWNAGVQAEWRKFILEFGRRGYLASPYCQGVYLHFFSPSNGEEFDLNSSTYAAEAKQAGLTSDVLMECMKYRIDTWVQAAGANIYKVAIVNPGSIADLNYPREELRQYAVSKGLGWRGGFIEHYYYGFLHPPLAGQVYTADGHVLTDWDSPETDGRIFSEENEEDDEFNVPGTETDLDPGKELDFMARSPYFRAAQVGLNFLWVSSKTIAWAGGNTGIANWYRLGAGKRPAEAPDAACWLREAQVRGLGSTAGRPFRNMERMLVQRDLEGARSVADELYHLAYIQLKDTANTDEYTARRTDVQTLQSDLAFEINPAFKASLAYPVQIKVHYLDKTNALWTLRVSTTGGTTVDLGNVQGTGAGVADPVWRTATFDCNVPFVPGALGANIDFAVHAISGGDVCVRYVRVVRTVDSARAAVIKVTPSGGTYDSGTPLALHVVARGTEPLSYQWKKDGQTVGTGRILDLGNVPAANSGSYTVVVSNDYGSVESPASVLQVADTAPTIVTHPVSVVSEPDKNVSLYVYATGSATLTYQWFKNGQSINGATAFRLTLTSVQEDSAAEYTVTVTNGFGSRTSQAALLTVLPTPPAITTPPANKAVRIGDAATFTVSAKGTAPLSYQWRKDGVNLPGHTGASLTLTNVQLAQAGAYSVVVTNNVGSAESAGASLQVQQVFADWVIPFSLPAGQATMAATPAGDGVSNLLAYVLGLDPRSDKTRQLPSAAIVNAQGAPPATGEPAFLALDIARSPSAADVALVVELSSNLQTWQSGPAVTTVLVDTPSRLFARDLTALVGPAARFARLKATYVSPDTTLFSTVLDDFEDGNFTTPAWTKQVGAVTPVAATVTYAIAGGTPDGTSALQIDYNNPSTPTFHYAILVRTPALYGAAWAAASPGPVNAFRFWFRGKSTNNLTGASADSVMRFQIRQGSSGPRFSFNIPAAAVNSDTWQQITAPLAQFYPDEVTGTFNLSAVDQIRIYDNRAGKALTIYVDKIEAIRQP